MLQLVSLLFFTSVGIGAGTLIVATLVANSAKIAVALRLQVRPFVSAPPPVRARARIVKSAMVVRSAERMRAAA